LVLCSEALRRAQAEIDTIVGNDSLPTFENRSSVPFIEPTPKNVNPQVAPGPPLRR
ncbi:hypothetical protein PAXINDRAFT_89269, partial [Paxillus involutus ATCC 200175]